MVRISHLSFMLILLVARPLTAGDATLFDDEFTGAGPALGAAWAASGWHRDGVGHAVETEGGYATALVGGFNATRYSVEARLTISPFQGPSPADAVSLVVGQPSSTELDGVRLVYYPSQQLLTLARLNTNGGSGGEFSWVTLASTTRNLGNGANGWKVVADASTGTISAFIDSGGGYPASPTLSASGVVVPSLGWTGLVRESQSPGTVSVDRFTVRQPVSGMATASLTLINADTDQPVAGLPTLLDGAVLNLAQLPSRRLSVRAQVTGGTVGSVRFNYDGNAAYRIENAAPYALAGDATNGTDYLPWTPTIGQHQLVVTPYSGPNAGGSVGSPLSVSFTVIDHASLITAAINFQPAGSAVPSGHLADSGAVFGLRNGLVYGWNRVVPDTRERNSAQAPDQRHDTLILMQKTAADPVRELAVPNGTYLVELTAGDPSFFDSDYRISVEGHAVLTGVPTSSARFIGTGVIITVLDGKLTVRNVAGAINNKLCFIVITPAAGNG